MKWLSYVPEVLAAIAISIPLIVKLINEFESPGWGEEKLKAVLTALESVLRGLGIRDSIVSMIVKGATGIIDAYVALKNIIGEFVHGGEGD